MGKQTKFEKLAGVLRAEIRDRKPPKDSSAFSVRSIVSDHNVSIATVCKALDMLEAEDLIYKREKRGTFVKHDPEKKLRVLCMTETNSPDDNGIISRLNAKRLDAVCSVFSEHETAFEFAAYSEFRNPETLLRRFEQADGLLLSRGYVDERTTPLLKRFHGKIVLFRHDAPENLPFPCSQAVPEFRSAVTHFLELSKIEDSDAFAIIAADHTNSVERSVAIQESLAAFGIGKKRITVFPPLKIVSGTHRETVIGFTQKHLAELEGKIVFTTSEYIAQILLPVCGERKIRLLSFDNFEPFSMPEERAVISSIDPAYPAVAGAAAELLCDLIRKQDRKFYTVHVPAELYLRKTTTKQKDG